jgi:hypothetical protein
VTSATCPSILAILGPSLLPGDYRVTRTISNEYKDAR